MDPRTNAMMNRLAKGFDTLLASSVFHATFQHEIPREPDLVRRLACRAVRSKLSTRVKVAGKHALKDLVLEDLEGPSGARVATGLVQSSLEDVQAWLVSIGSARQPGFTLRGDKKLKEQVRKLHEVFSFFTRACNGSTTMYRDVLSRVEHGESIDIDMATPGTRGKGKSRTYDKHNVLFTHAPVTRHMLLHELGDHESTLFDARVFTFIYRTGILAAYLEKALEQTPIYNKEQILGTCLMHFTARHLQGLVVDVNEEHLHLDKHPGLVEDIILSFCTSGHCREVPACTGDGVGLDNVPCPFKNGCQLHLGDALLDNETRDVFPCCSFPVLKKVLAAISFKDSLDLEGLRRVVDLPGTMLDDALATATSLDLVETGAVYRLSVTGTTLVGAMASEQPRILAGALLAKEHVRDLLFKIHSSEDGRLPVKELDKTFYMLMDGKPGHEQKKALQSFIDLCVSSNLVNATRHKEIDEIEITTAGSMLLLHGGDLARNTVERERETMVVPVAGTCRGCGKPIGEGFVACGYCAKPVKEKCIKCGKELDPAYALCPWCGVVVVTSR